MQTPGPHALPHSHTVLHFSLTFSPSSSSSSSPKCLPTANAADSCPYVCQQHPPAAREHHTNTPHPSRAAQRSAAPSPQPGGGKAVYSAEEASCTPMPRSELILSWLLRDGSESAQSSQPCQTLFICLDSNTRNRSTNYCSDSEINNEKTRKVKKKIK